MKKINNIYEVFLTNGELTTKNLTENGFYSVELTKFVENGILTKVCRGVYSLASYDGFIEYGKELMLSNDLENALRSFNICLDANPTLGNAIYLKFLINLKLSHYDEVFDMLDSVYEYVPENYLNDVNLYMFLLSMFNELPAKNRDYVKHLKFDDCRLDSSDTRFSDINYQNRIRGSIFSQSFPLSVTLLRSVNEEGKESFFSLEIITDLVKKALAVMNNDRKKALDFIKTKDYKSLLHMLLEKQERQSLSDADKFNLDLANDYLTISESRLIPKPMDSSATTVGQAIGLNNYRLALTLSEEYTIKKRINKETNPVYLILKDINELINQIKNDADKKDSKESKENPKNAESADNFESFVYSLFTNDFDNAFIYLKKYMVGKGFGSFESFALDLIKLSIIDEDFTFKDSILSISLITRGKYNYDLASYVNGFYENLAVKNYEKARIYLDMVSKAQLFKVRCDFIDILEKILNAEDLNTSAYKEDGNIIQEKELGEHAKQFVPLLS